MAEESTSVAEPVVSEPTAEPVSFIGEDGNFTPNWREGLDEDIRNDACFNKYKDFNSLAKGLAHANRMIGKDKTAIPDDTFTEDQWNDFHKAGGRPDSAVDYNLVRPDDFPEELFDVKAVSSAQELFFKLGISQSQAQGLLEFDLARGLDASNNKNMSDEAASQEVVDNLHRKWGNAFEQKKHLGNLAVDKGAGGDVELKQRVLEKFGNDFDLIEIFSNVGSLFAEHGAVNPNEGIPTPGDIKQQIDKLMSHPDYNSSDKKIRTRAFEEVARLFEEKAKSEGRE